MGFNTEEQTYEFSGTKVDQIRQIGNAVSVAKMKACVGAIMADAAQPKAKMDGVKNHAAPAEKSADEPQLSVDRRG